MKNTNHRLKGLNLHSHDYLIEAALDQKWEETNRKGFIARPASQPQVDTPPWKSERLTASSDEAGRL
jgi:hypothetical protein